MNSLGEFNACIHLLRPPLSLGFILNSYFTYKIGPFTFNHLHLKKGNSDNAYMDQNYNIFITECCGFPTVSYLCAVTHIAQFLRCPCVVLCKLSCIWLQQRKANQTFLQNIKFRFYKIITGARAAVDLLEQKHLSYLGSKRAL